MICIICIDIHSFTKGEAMKVLKVCACVLIVMIFSVVIPCEAGKRHKERGHDGGGHEHHHHHQYRWFGVIPRPYWAPDSGYYVVPQYNYPIPPPYPVPPPPNFSIGAPMATEMPPFPERHEVILVPQERQSFEDYQKPIQIPIPETSAYERQTSVAEANVPQPIVPRPVAPRRIDPSKAATVEKYVIGEVSCPLDLPKGGIVKVCNAKSGKYKLSGQGDGKYFHQQECWFCENVLGGDYVRWHDRTQ